MAKVTRIDNAAPTLPSRLRVAAYARVSVDTDELMESLSAQGQPLQHAHPGKPGLGVLRGVCRCGHLRNRNKEAE
ncbi:hypothetical protein [Sphaerochaeta sp. UBA5849]|jgi:hypothetical protein|uniref:hypothetical protein n=1 Tax=Sphaerochaeta sp. UBA5849 TaxID=1947475 RepID=UPI0031F5A537